MLNVMKPNNICVSVDEGRVWTRLLEQGHTLTQGRGRVRGRRSVTEGRVRVRVQGLGGGEVLPKAELELGDEETSLSWSARPESSSSKMSMDSTGFN